MTLWTVCNRGMDSNKHYMDFPFLIVHKLGKVYEGYYSKLISILAFLSQILSLLVIIPQTKLDNVIIAIIAHPIPWNIGIYISCNTFTVEQKCVFPSENSKKLNTVYSYL